MLIFEVLMRNCPAKPIYNGREMCTYQIKFFFTRVLEVQFTMALTRKRFIIP